jgi:hypothetical protein
MYASLRRRLLPVPGLWVIMPQRDAPAPQLPELAANFQGRLADLGERAIAKQTRHRGTSAGRFMRTTVAAISRRTS